MFFLDYQKIAVSLEGICFSMDMIFYAVPTCPSWNDQFAWYEIYLISPEKGRVWI